MSSTNDDWSDEKFLGYVDIHCETERALFSREHARRLIKMSGMDQYENEHMPEFVRIPAIVAKPMIEKARARMERASHDPQPIDSVMASVPDRVRLTYAAMELADEQPVEPSDQPSVNLAIYDQPPKRVSLVLEFSEAGFGFGEITIVQVNGEVFVDTEHMTLARVKKYVMKLLDDAITDRDTDPERHRRFNEVMSQVCGAGCQVCYPPTKEKS